MQFNHCKICIIIPYEKNYTICLEEFNLVKFIEIIDFTVAKVYNFNLNCIIFYSFVSVSFFINRNIEFNRK